MVAIRRVDRSDLPTLRRLHNRYTDSDVSLSEIEDLSEENPELLLGAYDEGDSDGEENDGEATREVEDDRLVGYALGLDGPQPGVQLGGIAVRDTHQNHGIGSDLLAAFEKRAADLGFERASLGSAGGYVDAFYVNRGYRPSHVRVAPDDPPENYRDLGYEIADETVEDESVVLSVAVDGYEPSLLEEVREAFGDPEAIYIMEKDLSRGV
jgi:GNAT superfamily N-acetyltransferase